jgi:membrane associated rhomboid family serine protease
MFPDRPYLRDDYPRRGRAALTWLLCAIAAGFVMEAVFTRLLPVNQSLFTHVFTLTWSGLREWRLWQLVTYAFVHPVQDALSVLQVGFNLLCLYLIGREIETLLSTKRFLWFYLGATLVGAIAWTGIHYRFDSVLYGAWPGIAACITLFACLHPRQELSLLFFFIPLRFLAKHIVWGLLAYDLIGFAFWEALGRKSAIGENHSAHLGGMLAGFLYHRFVHLREWRNPDGNTAIELPSWLRKSRKAAAATGGSFKLNLTTREDLAAEVDRILDKINSEGFGALTPEEKRLLDDARDQLSQR